MNIKHALFALSGLLVLTVSCNQNSATPAPVKRSQMQAAMDAPIDLGTLGGSSSEAHDINNQGQVVGSSENAQFQTRAFIWSAATGMRDLGTLGGNTAVAQDINNAGQVVGYSQTASGAVHAFLWTDSTGMQDLGTLGGDRSEATSINDYGEIVGVSRTTPNSLRERAFFRHVSGGALRDLGILGNRTAFYDGSSAVGINNNGLIAGTSSSAERDSQAMYWVAGTPDKLSLGQVPSAFYNQATAINNRNQIVGFSLLQGENNQRAFIWRPGTGLVTLPEGAWRPNAISDDGVVVGNGGDRNVFYWSTTTGLQSLPTFNQFARVNGVNNKRQAVGAAAFPGSGSSDNGGPNLRAALWNLPLESYASLWDDTVRPDLEADPEVAALELGVRFKSSVAGQIVGIRYFLGLQSGGRIDSVSLWDDQGRQIATTKVDFQIAGGWQRADFSTPVSIQSGRTYTASYHTLSGRYPVSEGYFTNPYQRGVLEAPESAGVYRYGSESGFPDRTYNSSNYWVDVVFKVP
jgi:probable HAF family extracellular repeat protein